MALDVMFAFLAGVSVAAYSIFLRLASAGIHPALGATVVTGVAFLAGLSARAEGSAAQAQGSEVCESMRLP